MQSLRYKYPNMLHKNTAFCEKHGAHDTLAYIYVYNHCHCVSMLKFYLRNIILVNGNKKFSDVLICNVPQTKMLGGA